MMLAQQGSPDKAGMTMEHLERTSETLELALSRITPSEKEVKGLSIVFRNISFYLIIFLF